MTPSPAQNLQSWTFSQLVELYKCTAAHLERSEALALEIAVTDYNFRAVIDALPDSAV